MALERRSLNKQHSGTSKPRRSHDTGVQDAGAEVRPLLRAQPGRPGVRRPRPPGSGRHARRPCGRAAASSPRSRSSATGKDVVVRVELPGVDVERDVTIEVDRGKLVVSGERRDSRESQAEGVLVRELRYGQFRREFALPPGVSPEQVEASYDAGLLDVRVRGVVAPEPTVVKVPITTAGGRRTVEAPARSESTAEADERDASSSIPTTTS